MYKNVLFFYNFCYNLTSKNRLLTGIIDDFITKDEA